jgi:Protein of unknown function (DUF4197)
MSLKLLIRVLMIIFFSFCTSSCLTISNIDVPDFTIGNKPDKLNESTVISGLKEALEIGTRNAVEFLSIENGFYRNTEIKIYLPEELKEIDKTLRKIGLSKKMDEFEETMNHAAEQACILAADIFVDAITDMSFSDAWGILNGSDDAATRYLELNYRVDLYNKFIPVVKKSMDDVGLNQIYKFILNKYNSIPFIEKQEYDLDTYITDKALDALFLIVEREEKEIRVDPVARVTDLLKKVFG